MLSSVVCFTLQRSKYVKVHHACMGLHVCKTQISLIPVTVVMDFMEKAAKMVSCVTFTAEYLRHCLRKIYRSEIYTIYQYWPGTS